MNSIHTDRFWLSNTGFSPAPLLRGTARADVTVIGGGITGLSAAYHLKEADPALNVTLIEKEAVGGGASGRNAGFVRRSFGLNLRYSVFRFGKRRARIAWSYMDYAVNYLAEFIKKNALNCDFQQHNFLRFATNQNYLARLQTEVELAHNLGISGMQWLSYGQLQQGFASPLMLGACEESGVGMIHPVKFLRDLRDRVIDKGVRLYEHTPAEHVYDTSPIRIETPEGEILSGKVIFATNGFSHRFPHLRRLQIPAYSYAILTRPLTDEELQGMGWEHCLGMKDMRNFPVYLRLTPEHRLLVGGGNIEFVSAQKKVFRRSNRFLQDLIHYLGELFPQGKYIDIENKWKGTISIPLDMTPLIGHMKDPRFIYSLGYVGHGIPMALMNGRIITDLTLERHSEFTDLFFVNRYPIPCPIEPLRFGISKAIRGYMHLQDQLLERAGS